MTLTFAQTEHDNNIDDGVCTSCNMTVTHDEESDDDEVCIRTKPYCTKHINEHVDWRATCKHVQSIADDAVRLLHKVVTGGNPTSAEWKRINDLIRMAAL